MVIINGRGSRQKTRAYVLVKLPDYIQENSLISGLAASSAAVDDLYGQHQVGVGGSKYLPVRMPSNRDSL